MVVEIHSIAFQRARAHRDLRELRETFSAESASKYYETEKNNQRQEKRVSS